MLVGAETNHYKLIDKILMNDNCSIQNTLCCVHSCNLIWLSGLSNMRLYLLCVFLTICLETTPGGQTPPDSTEELLGRLSGTRNQDPGPVCCLGPRLKRC